MLKMTHSLPKEKIKLAFSGGVDSLVVAHFWRRNPNVTLLHFNHGCEHSDEIEKQVRDRAQSLGMNLIVGNIDGEKSSGESLEDFWRKQRYRFLYNEAGEHVVTAHHLDDAIETWIWSSLHGEGKIISPKQEIEYGGKKNILHRPFVLTKKDSIREYAEHHGLVPVDDPYNRENGLVRNYIRANMMEHVRFINPGIDKVIRKKYLNTGV